MKIRDIARVCHEANRAYCKAIGDDSQVPWNEAPEWQRQSAMKGVVFSIENPNASPSAQHDAWLSDKERDGWTYGTVKDEGAKTRRRTRAACPTMRSRRRNGRRITSSLRSRRRCSSWTANE